jgi:hypothetical protein
VESRRCSIAVRLSEVAGNRGVPEWGGSDLTIGILAASIRGYFGAYVVYAKGKFNLFRIFAGILGGYDRKEGRV